MARYKLMSHIVGEEEQEVGGQRKKTKEEIEQWIKDNVKACGLDWRVGYTIKLGKGAELYVWRWIKDNKEVNK